MLTIGIGWLLAAQTASPALTPEIIKLAAIRRQMTAALEQTTNFTCLETIDRYRGAPNEKPRTDRVRVEVAYSGGKELFAFPGEDRFSTRHLAEMLGGGTASSGDFVGHLRSVFLAPGATIRFGAREGALLRYDYEIPAFGSGYHVHAGGSAAEVRITGSFWADETALDVERLTVIGADMPAAVDKLAQTIHYARVAVRTGTVLLPQRSQMRMTMNGGRVDINRTEFSHCRDFGADSSVRFDSEAAATAATAGSSEETVKLPPGLTISVILERETSLGTARVGDPLEASVSGTAGPIPSGARVRGRLRWLERRDLGPGDEEPWTAGIEFTEVRWGKRRARFLADFVSLSNAAGLDIRDARSRSVRANTASRDLLGFGRIEQIQREEEVTPLQLPGVYVFRVAPAAKKLPRGFETVWKTVD